MRLVERTAKARHKVCGEFLSPGAGPVLEALQVWSEFRAAGPCRIRRAVLHLQHGSTQWTLAEPGWGLSRLRLDQLLLDKAAALDARVSRGEVFDGRAETRPGGPLVLACGRRAAAPRGDRLFGFKAHFEGPGDDAVELFFDRYGYVGVSGVEDGLTNVCGIASESTLGKYGFDFDEAVRRSAPLAERLRPLRRTMRWVVTGPVCFSFPGAGGAPPDGYAAGDALGFVDPFTGSGMLNALYTGRLAGQAAARGTSAWEYRRECGSLLARPFLISSALRRLAGRAVFHRLARHVPGRLLFGWTRADLSRTLR